LTVVLSPCFHNELPNHKDVRDAVSDALTKARANSAGTVFYSQYDPTTYHTTLHVKVGDRAPRQITPDFRGVVSPDGQHVAWADLDDDRNATLVVSDLDGTNRRPVATGANGHGLCNVPEWAPDSSRILFQQTTNTATSAGTWAVVDVRSGEKTLLDGATGCYPVWAPDGGSIAWNVSPPPAGSSTIRITDAAGRNGRFIPHIQGVADPCFNSVAALSAAGRFALVEPSAQSRVACGDGPGKAVHDGIVVDTTTGSPIPLPVTGSIRSGRFLADGGIVLRTAGTQEFTLLDPRQRITRIPEGSLDEETQIQAYIPN
jgi:hypothetical protein